MLPHPTVPPGERHSLHRILAPNARAPRATGPIGAAAAAVVTVSMPIALIRSSLKKVPRFTTVRNGFFGASRRTDPRVMTLMVKVLMLLLEFTLMLPVSWQKTNKQKT